MQIPKRMVFFWGNRKMSWLRYMTLYSFRKYHPDWGMTLYVCDQEAVTEVMWSSPEKQDFFTYNGPDYLPMVKDLGIEVRKYEVPDSIKYRIGPSHKSNFFKWHMMWESGGWYSDMDILWVRSMTDTYEWLKHVNTVLAWNGSYFSIGLLASTPDNAFYHGVYDNGFKTARMSAYQSAGVLNVYDFLNGLRAQNPKVCSEVAPGDHYGAMTKLFPELKPYSLPMSFVYPWSYRQMDKVFHQKFDIPSTTAGIHWYAGCALAQEYNCKLNEGNFQQFHNTLCYPLETVLNHDPIEIDVKSQWLKSKIQESTKWCNTVVEFGPMFGKRLKQVSSLVKTRIGLEASPVYCSMANGYDFSMIHGDIRQFEEYISPSQSDCVMMIDVIEHLTKADGVDLLKRCQRFFKRIVVATPEGFDPQDEDFTGYGQDDLQSHRSGWTLEELEGYGFVGEVYPNYQRGMGYLFATWTSE